MCEYGSEKWRSEFVNECGCRRRVFDSFWALPGLVLMPRP